MALHVDQQTFRITFDGISTAEAVRLAADLQKQLQTDGLQVKREREDDASMDFGTTIVLILGAPAVVIASKALQSWVVRKNAASIKIEASDGSLVAKGMESKDAAALADAFARCLSKPPKK